MHKIFLFLTIVLFSVTPESYLSEASEIGTHTRYLTSVPQPSSQCCAPQTIVSVSGVGSVTGIPDTATFSVTVTATDKTSSKSAESAAAALTNQVNAVLDSFSVPNTDRQTTGLSVNPVYDYSDGNPKLTGQQATQSISVTVRRISPENGAPVGDIIDGLVEINGIVISGVSFSISDQTAYLEQARGFAFNDAKSKALQYAQLSLMSLGNPLKISDSTSANVPYPLYFAKSAAQDTQTTVSVGTFTVRVEISIDWSLGLLTTHK